MQRSLLSICLAAILVLAVPSAFNNFGGTQENPDHASHTAEIAAAGPSVDDRNHRRLVYAISKVI